MVPVRLITGVMIFFACWVNYMTRVNMSVNIIAMVPRDVNITSVKSECEALVNNTKSLYSDPPDLSKNRKLGQRPGLATFDWTAQQQGYILSAYFWGYVITCFLGGRGSEMIGPRRLVFSTTLFTAVLNTLTPQAAQLHYMALIALRFSMGLAAGFMLPALHDLLTRWAPPDEKNKFISGMLGGAIGTVFTWSLSGPLIEKLGWDYAFYLPGIIVVVWCLMWWYLVYDSPLEHPRISDSEKHYIINAIGKNVEQVSKNRVSPPYKNIFMSSPFLAMTILHCGNAWGVYFIMTAAPKYVSSALGYKLSSTGTLASLPYLARMIFSLFFGVIGDRIIKMNVVSTTFLRKFCVLFSHIIPGLLLILISYVGCSPILSIALITLSLGFNGAATLTNLVNHHDLAPNFAATMFSIANGIGNIAGFITPLVTAHFTKNGNGVADWRPVFYTGGGLYIATAFYFILFGTAKIQSWNYVVLTKVEHRSRSNSIDNDSPKSLKI